MRRPASPSRFARLAGTIPWLGVVAALAIALRGSLLHVLAIGMGFGIVLWIGAPLTVLYLVWLLVYLRRNGGRPPVGRVAPWLRPVLLLLTAMAASLPAGMYLGWRDLRLARARAERMRPELAALAGDAAACEECANRLRLAPERRRPVRAVLDIEAATPEIYVACSGQTPRIVVTAPHSMFGEWVLPVDAGQWRYEVFD